MYRKLFPALFLALVSSCAADVFSLSGSGPLVVRSGTSFGMCIGYCRTVLSIDHREIVLRETSSEPAKYPERVRRQSISQSEWEQLRALVDPAALAALPETHGCPDCADGGAEWVEIELDGERQRTVFEYGASIPEIDPLLTRLREIRARFR